MAQALLRLPVDKKENESPIHARHVVVVVSTVTTFARAAEDLLCHSALTYE